MQLVYVSSCLYESIDFRFGRPAPAAARIKVLAAAGAGPVLLWIGSCPVFKAPAIVSGFEDVAVVGQAVEQCRFHLGITKHVGPFTEAEIGGDDDAGLLIELAE